ncbi:hypothetical protein [Nonomuraea candida]|uniref:hypothetical protein n=1 Tax=Nonomuraea candida TaxID=359159 RepID=UPI0012FC4374|nr:hypothetical protein [Nonomuraea candida]
MEPEHGLSRGSAALIVLVIVWFFGTLSLGYAALYYGLVIGTGPSRDGDLAHTLIYAAITLGIGAPVVGLAIAIRLHHKAGTWVYGLIVLGLVVLGISALSGQRDNHVYKEDPAICTAPPELALEVPGC